jgi:hypothetical protein
MIGASVARIVIYSTGKVVSVNALKEEVETTPLILSLCIRYSGQIRTPAFYSQGEETH